jgi:hypothetical protein
MLDTIFHASYDARIHWYMTQETSEIEGFNDFVCYKVSIFMLWFVNWQQTKTGIIVQSHTAKKSDVIKLR